MERRGASFEGHWNRLGGMAHAIFTHDATLDVPLPERSCAIRYRTDVMRERGAHKAHAGGAPYNTRHRHRKGGMPVAPGTCLQCEERVRLHQVE